MRLNKTQVLLIVGSVVLIVLFLFANTKIPKKDAPVDVAANNVQAETFQSWLNELVEGLNPEQKKLFTASESLVKMPAADSGMYQKSVQQWDSLKQPVIAAYLKEKQAQAFGTEKNWEEAGRRYYAIAGFLDNEKSRMIFEKSALCFENVLALNSNNTDVKIDLASCYVEQGSNPMKGIAMLKELEKTDSTNVKLQLNFAFFSVKSGQWDKAIMRFEKALKLKPDYIEIYLHLADAYTQVGNKEKVILNLEKFAVLTDDLTLREEVRGYINKLKIN